MYSKRRYSAVPFRRTTSRQLKKVLQECVQKGPLAGYPVVGVKATLLDGSYHPVDSSEMAFKMAATLAFKKGVHGSKSSSLRADRISESNCSG